jgi:site-specific recombinase XerD
MDAELKKNILRPAIAAAYSAHDLRHLYAVTEYRKDRDLYRVSKPLGHASIQVTEKYLRDMGEVD